MALGRLFAKPRRSRNAKLRKTQDATRCAQIERLPLRGGKLLSANGVEFHANRAYIERIVPGSTPLRASLQPLANSVYRYETTLSSDGRRIACVGQNNAVIILDATTLEELIVLKTPLTPISLAFSADGSALIGCSDKG